jgi:type 1 fimbriae regulatory protein FimE
MPQPRGQRSFSAKLQLVRRPTPPLKQKRSPAVRDYLRPDEVEAMVQAARKSGRHPVRDAAIILMMFRHGLRTAELIALRWHQVDLKAGYLDVHRAKRGHHAKHPLRGPQLRLLRELQRTYPPAPYVFVSERKAPLSPRSIREIVARTGKVAGLLFVPHPHQLRHACGYDLASQGHDTRAVQDYLGHKNIQHTVRYTAMAPHRFENFWLSRNSRGNASNIAPSSG